MPKARFSRRDVLKGSTAIALSMFASPTRAAPPEASAITPQLIEAAKKEGKVVYYTSVDLPLAEKIAKAFEAKIGPNTIVLDVRDLVQRDSPLFPFKEQRVQLDEKDKLDAIIEQAKREKKTLLVYDAVGRQVDWFQYSLERKGLSDYYFMKGGAQGHFDAKHGKISLGAKKEAKAEVKAEPAAAKTPDTQGETKK